MEKSGQLHFPAILPPREVASSTHFIAGCMDQNQSGRRGEEKISTLCPESNQDF
jgi:hypothetical protein